MKNIIFIDPSKTSTGIYYKGEKEIIKTLRLNKKKKESFYEHEARLYKYYNEVFQEIFKNNIIKLVVIEDYAFSRIKMSSSITALSEVKGMIKNIAYNNDCYIVPMSINIWKSFSKIIADKKEPQKYIEQANKIYKKEFKTTDELDAFLMYCATELIMRGITKTIAQLEYRDRIKNLMGEK